MNYEIYFKDLFESIPDYRKVVLILFLIQNDKDFLKQCGFLRIDIHRLSLEYKKSLLTEKDEYFE